MRHQFKFLDMFAGIGGFHHALAELGGVCVLACELDSEARNVYQKTFEEAENPGIIVENIRDLTRADPANEMSLLSREEVRRRVPDHDLLCAGFPCQPFSKSGGQQGVRDKTRGTLFHDLLQIIDAKQPTYIFLENVRNLAGPRHVDTWHTIVSSLQELGYQLSAEPLIFSPHLLSPEMGGAPQVRERVFILGVRNDKSNGQLKNILDFHRDLNEKVFWNPDQWKIFHYLDADHLISDLPDYEISENESMYLEAWDYFVANLSQDLLPGFPIWAFAFRNSPALEDGMPAWESGFLIKNSHFYLENRGFIDSWTKMKWGKSRLTVAEFPVSRQKFEWQARKHHPGKTGRTLKDLVIQFRPSGIRVKPPTYLPALVAITQTSVVGPLLRKGSDRYRKLTPIEAARLQGVPDAVYSRGTVTARAAYKQLGNAVNVGLVRKVAEILMGCSTANESRQAEMSFVAR